jgi:hypothetical protein
MYSKRVLDYMRDEIEQQIQAMPNTFSSADFYVALQNNYPVKYEDLVSSYIDPVTDHRHAIQKMHAQLMHTVNACFSQLTRKVATVANPKGGDMSQWERL